MLITCWPYFAKNLRILSEDVEKTLRRLCKNYFKNKNLSETHFLQEKNIFDTRILPQILRRVRFRPLKRFLKKHRAQKNKFEKGRGSKIKCPKAQGPGPKTRSSTGLAFKSINKLPISISKAFKSFSKLLKHLIRFQRVE